MIVCLILDWLSVIRIVYKMSRKLCLGSGRPTIRQILQHLTICVRKLSVHYVVIWSSALYFIYLMIVINIRSIFWVI
jgi:hypothetical protein